MTLIFDRSELEKNGFVGFGAENPLGKPSYFLLAGGPITVSCRRTRNPDSYRVLTANDANGNSYEGETLDNEPRFQGKTLSDFLQELREPTNEPSRAP
jgi:hypothetical protein